MRDRLDGIASGSWSCTHVFWSDRARGRVLATLQDRVWRAGILMEVCRAALARVHQALFPPNEQSQGLAALMKRFHDGKAIKKFVRDQLVGGATVALALVRVHRPHLDLDKIAKGLPPLSGGGVVPMEEHYQATAGPADSIIAQVERETELLVDPKEENVG